MGLVPAMALFAATESDPWTRSFFGLDVEKRFVVILVALGCLTGIIATLAGVIGSCVGGMQRRRLDADMKRDMLDRGMTPDEIVRIIEAKPRTGFDKWWTNLGQRSSQDL